ncbi:MAG: hypothetical protein AB7H71_12255 [Alphaproteobacteria bacterium]
MAVQLEIIVIAAVVGIGLIVAGRWIGTEFAIRRRRANDVGKPAGTRVSPDAGSLPPGG